jgi:uncharacterized protein (UPF0276 family)
MWDAHSHPVPTTDIEWLERLLPGMVNCSSIIIERDERLQQGDELVRDIKAVVQVVERVAAEAVPALH